MEIKHTEHKTKFCSTTILSTMEIKHTEDKTKFCSTAIEIKQ
jgi:hypothetical protein